MGTFAAAIVVFDACNFGHAKLTTMTSFEDCLLTSFKGANLSHVTGLHLAKWGEDTLHSTQRTDARHANLAARQRERDRLEKVTKLIEVLKNVGCFRGDHRRIGLFSNGVEDANLLFGGDYKKSGAADPDGEANALRVRDTPPASFLFLSQHIRVHSSYSSRHGACSSVLFKGCDKARAGAHAHCF